MILSAKLLFYQIQTDADILKQRYIPCQNRNALIIGYFL